jgi:RNA polymerase sigma factor (TIGR02999 family)
MAEITHILNAIEPRDSQAAEQLLPVVYKELRRLAAVQLARESPGHTLNPTALVHEAYLRLVGEQRFENRRHFFVAAAEAMRRILIEYARRKKARKHGGGLARQPLDEADWISTITPDKLLAVDEALAKLAGEDAPAAAVVELRYFAGLSVEETAEVLGLSRATAYRHWTYARAWLRCELTAADSDSKKTLDS